MIHQLYPTPLSQEKKKRNLILNQMEQAHLINVLATEIRVPLSEFMGATQGILEDKKVMGEYRFYIEQISQCGEKIQQISNQFIDFMKYSHMLASPVGNNVIHMEKELKSIIQNTIEKVGKSPLVNLIIDYKRGSVPTITACPEILRYFLEPLLTNALRFTHEGHITISVTAAKANDSKIMLNLSVSDTGTGIPESKLEGICDMFTAHSTGHANYKNAGLKLSILKESVAIANGQMTLQTKANEGTKIDITLPFNVCQSAIQNWDAALALEKTHKGLIPVLIIDDSDFYAISFSKRLEALGCYVDVVYSGEEGLALLNLRKNHYHTIFLDVNLPGAISGLDIAKFIHKDIKQHPLQHPWLVGCTAYSTQEELNRCLDAGMDYAFSKPMHLKDLKLVLGILDEDLNDGTAR